MTGDTTEQLYAELQTLTGHRRGPFCSYNPVNRTQIWQWCSALDDRNPLYLDDGYRAREGLGEPAVAPPAMMQMWTMRDIHMRLAPGSTDEPAYAIFDLLTERGFPGNVAVSYDIRFHHLLREGDRAQHYTSIHSVSELKRTALGEGFFVVEHAEYLDQREQMYAEAFITYFQYRPTSGDARPAPSAAKAPPAVAENRQPDFRNLRAGTITAGDSLPDLVIPITHKLIVGGAIASQDFMDVHHNAPAARAAAMPDIFMNILTTCGLCGRYLTDWAGAGSRLRALKFKLQAPNTPGDTMVLRGRVTEVGVADDPAAVGVEFAGENARGTHVTGTATVELAG